MIAPLLLQTGTPTSAVALVSDATPVSKAVLAFLAALSVMSWVIIFAAWRDIGRVQRAGRTFLAAFERVPRLGEAEQLVRQSPPSAFTRLYEQAMRFVAETRSINRNGPNDHSAGVVELRPLRASQVETLHLILDTEASNERDRLGRMLPWLATVGSVSPLIGLFGTVLGVIEAFVGIASQGSGNLAAVAPGVAEALIATAAALAVAIPATFAYNILANRLNRVDAVFETFGTTLVAMLVREGHA